MDVLSDEILTIAYWCDKNTFLNLRLLNKTIKTKIDAVHDISLFPSLYYKKSVSNRIYPKDWCSQCVHILLNPKIVFYFNTIWWGRNYICDECEKRFGLISRKEWSRFKNHVFSNPKILKNYQIDKSEESELEEYSIENKLFQKATFYVGGTNIWKKKFQNIFKRNK